jgi:osmotically-inducible protein OsmY
MAEISPPISEWYACIERDLGTNVKEHILAEGRGGTVILSGEVEDIAAKRRAAHLAKEMFGATHVQDQLTVRPAQAREDGAIRDSLLLALTGESVFRRFGVNSWHKEEMHIIRDVQVDAEGHLDVIVDSGIVTLAGEVWSVSHSRFAELLAWWSPGVRAVINQIAIAPPEGDTDDDITDAVRLALEKDPLVHSDQIKVTTRDQVVTLDGLVRAPEERQMAEMDVWYLGGATSVQNRIQVQRPSDLAQG